MFTEIAARLWHMLRAVDRRDDAKGTKVSITFPTPALLVEFEMQLKSELKPYMFDMTGPLTAPDLSSFKFNGITWELKIDESVSSRPYARYS